MPTSCPFALHTVSMPPLTWIRNTSSFAPTTPFSPLSSTSPSQEDQHQHWQCHAHHHYHQSPSSSRSSSTSTSSSSWLGCSLSLHLPFLLCLHGIAKVGLPSQPQISVAKHPTAEDPSMPVLSPPAPEIARIEY